MEDRKKRVARLKLILRILPIIMVVLPCVMNLILIFGIWRSEGLPQKLEVLGTAVRTYLEQQEALAERQEPAESDFVQIEEMPEDELLYDEIFREDGTDEIPWEPEEISDKRKVYLTFDDGPSPYTERILDILKEYDVKATFFVTATQIEGYEDVCRRIVDEGHGLGIHTYSHVYHEIYSSIDQFEKDIRRIQNYLYRLTGKVVMIYRFPGGSSNTVSRIPAEEMIQWLNEEGIVYFDWNVSPEGNGGQVPGAEQITANCLRGVRQYDPVVVLLHDSYEKKSTIEALPHIIEGILKLEDTVLLSLDRKTAPVQHISITKE